MSAGAEVSFHTGVPDKLDYSCRLLRKASRQAARVVVTGAVDELERLDRALWVFEVDEFIAHLHLRAGQTVSPSQRRTPIWLSEDEAVDVDATVIVNLGPRFARGYERFARVIEVVSTAEPDVQSGRLRWRQFVAAGRTPVNRPYRPNAA